MSVPLDRLYHYLADIVDHDLVIYRWAPHGSRKLEDLIPLEDYKNEQKLTSPQVVCHDQEPLCFTRYSPFQFYTATKSLFTKGNLTHLLHEDLLNYYSKLNFRSILTVNNQFNGTILLHSELHSAEVKKYQQANFVPVYHWSHGIIAGDWFRYANHDPALCFNLDYIQQDFLIYNRSWSGTREYRLCFVEHLVQAGLLLHTKTNFNPWDNNCYYTDYQFANDKLQIYTDDLHKHLQPTTADSNASADYNSHDYHTSGIEIVLETLFDDCRWHLTEKTLRPIACGKPFMLMSTAGSLKYLKRYGFKTFDGLINESYDEITDPKLRLKSVIQEMQRIANMPWYEKQHLYQQLHEIAKQNKTHFFQTFSDIVSTEYVNNMNSALALLPSLGTGTYHAKTKQLLTD